MPKLSENWFKVPKSVGEQIYALAGNGDANYVVTQAILFYIANKDKITDSDRRRYERHYRAAIARERKK